MTVRIGAGLSTAEDPREGAETAAVEAAATLRGAACDVAVVFASGRHLEAPEILLGAVGDVLGPGVVAGCGARGILGPGQEIEGGTAVSVWAASLGAGTATPFHAVVTESDDGLMAGLPDLEGASGAVMLADPRSFPAEPILHVLNEWLPEVPLVGGLASASLASGAPALFLDEDAVDGGAVGIRFDGIEMAPCVSQGAAPIGPEMTITAAEGSLIVELAGKPAYEKLREVIADLPPMDLLKLEASGGLLLGLVVDANKPDYVQGDFLVRPLVGADSATGALAIGALPRVGQVVRLHVRDAESADRDLRDVLAGRTAALHAPPAGALVFACNGRGSSMFGTPGHDAAAVEAALAGAPSAGFFAAGEIGPVAGECHLHGFTATIALFA